MSTPATSGPPAWPPERSRIRCRFPARPPEGSHLRRQFPVRPPKRVSVSVGLAPLPVIFSCSFSGSVSHPPSFLLSSLLLSFLPLLSFSAPSLCPALVLPSLLLLPLQSVSGSISQYLAPPCYAPGRISIITLWDTASEEVQLWLITHQVQIKPGLPFPSPPDRSICYAVLCVALIALWSFVSASGLTLVFLSLPCSSLLD